MMDNPDKRNNGKVFRIFVIIDFVLLLLSIALIVALFVLTSRLQSESDEHRQAIENIKNDAYLSQTELGETKGKIQTLEEMIARCDICPRLNTYGTSSPAPKNANDKGTFYVTPNVNIITHITEAKSSPAVATTQSTLDTTTRCVACPLLDEIGASSASESAGVTTIYAVTQSSGETEQAKTTSSVSGSDVTGSDIITTTSTEKACPSDWLHASNGLCYRLFLNEKVNYTTAKSRCAQIGARLAAAGLRTAAMRREIMKNIFPSPFPNTWIGLDDIQTQGTYVWSDGVLSTNANTDWGRVVAVEPDNPNQRCAGMHRAHRGAVADLYCKNTLNYICEMSL